MDFNTDRREVKTDRLPNKTWALSDLISVGLAHGVDFGLDSDELGYLMRHLDIPQVLNILYSQVEFVEYQDPVEEYQNRKARPIDLTDLEFGTQRKAKVTYKGNMMMTRTFLGRSQLFIPGVDYYFGPEYMDFIRVLMQDEAFDVQWDVVGEDSIMKTLRAVKHSLEGPTESEEDQAYGVIFV